MDMEAELLIPCGYCQAQPGSWCRTSSGGRATWLHSTRTEPARVAWIKGWEAGQAEGRDREVRAATGAKHFAPRGWQGPFIDAVAGLVSLTLSGRGRGYGRSTARRLLAARILTDDDTP